MKFNVLTWSLLGFLYIVYVIYGTLLPFDFSFSIELIKSNLRDIEWIDHYGRMFYTTRNVDAIANFIFFIPLGIIFYNIRFAASTRIRTFNFILIATLWGFMFSGLIEILQLFIHTRKTSFIDLLTNTAGCATGAVFSALMPHLVNMATRIGLHKAINKIPHILLLLLLFILSLSFPENFSMYFLKTEKIGNIIFNWQYIIKPYWIWQFLFLYIPIGILITRMIHKTFQQKPLFKVHLISFVIAFLLTVSIEYLRWLLYHGTPAFINLLYAILGILTGIAMTEIIRKQTGIKDEKVRKRAIYTITGIVVYLCSLIVYKYAYPFNLEKDIVLIHEKIRFFFFSIYSFIPFNGILKLFIYSVQNMLLFIPIGMMLMELELYMKGKYRNLILFASASFLVILPIGLQLVNSEQTPFLYEIPTNTIGLFGGYFAWYIFRKVADQEITG